MKPTEYTAVECLEYLFLFYTKNALADKLKVSVRTIERWATEEAKPRKRDLDTLRKKVELRKRMQ